MKRNSDNLRDEDEPERSKISPTIGAMIQHAATNNLISNIIPEFSGNLVGENIQEITSPTTPATKIIPRKLTQAFPQSSYWMNQLGKKTGEENRNPESKPEETELKKTSQMRMRKITSEDWEKMEAGIQCSKEKNSMRLLEILKKVQEERKKNTSNIDPIINKEIRLQEGDPSSSKNGKITFTKNSLHWSAYT